MARPTDARKRRAARTDMDVEDTRPPDVLDAEQRPLDPMTGGHEVAFTDSDLKKLSDEFKSEINAEIGARSGDETKWKRWQRVYDSQPRDAVKSYPMDSASNIVVPLAAIYSETLVARVMQSIFAVDPHWKGTALNKRHMPIVSPLERWLDWRRRHVWNQYGVVKSAVQETTKLGTSVIFTGWRDIQRMRYDDVQTRRTLPVGRVRGPHPQWVPRDDVIVPSGYYDPQTAPYFAHRVWMSFDQLRALEHAQFVESVADVKGHSDDETEMRRARRAAEQAGETHKADRNDLYAVWNVWFTRDFDGDGYPEEWVMMLHATSGTILRLQANPYPSQMRPYVVTKLIEREGAFDGIGVPEQVEQLQAEASTIHNQRRDRAHLANIVMYIAGAGAHGVGESIRPRSGKVLKVLDASALKEFHPSTNVQIDAFEEQVVTMLADRRVGVNELSEGKVTSPVGRAAATTVMAMMQEGARRFDLMISEFRDALSEQAHQVLELDQTHGLPAPDEPGSPEQVLDLNDAAALRAFLTETPELRTALTLDLRTSTQAVNREVEKQSNIQLMQLMGGYVVQVLQLASGAVRGGPPEITAAIGKLLTGFDMSMRKVFQSFQAYDLEDALVGELFAQMAAQQAQQPMGMGVGGPMGAMGGGAGNGAAPPMPMLPAPGEQ